MEAIVFLIILAVLAVAILGLLDQIGKKRRKSEAAARLKQNYNEARDFARRRQLPSIRVSILLQTGEQGIMEEPSVFSEARGHQSFGGGGVEVEGVMVGGLTSRTVDEVNEIDSGTLVLTNRRLVFTGKMENRSVQLKDLLSVRHTVGAIEVSASGKSQFYAVRNPVIWAESIQQIAGRAVQRSA